MEGISQALKGFTEEEQEIVVTMLNAYENTDSETEYAAFVHAILLRVHPDVPLERLDKIVDGMNRLKPKKIILGPREEGTSLNLDIVPTGEGHDRLHTRPDEVPTSDGVSRSTQAVYEQGDQAW